MREEYPSPTLHYILTIFLHLVYEIPAVFLHLPGRPYLLHTQHVQKPTVVLPTVDNTRCSANLSRHAPARDRPRESTPLAPSACSNGSPIARSLCRFPFQKRLLRRTLTRFLYANLAALWLCDWTQSRRGRMRRTHSIRTSYESHLRTRRAKGRTRRTRRTRLAPARWLQQTVRQTIDLQRTFGLPLICNDELLLYYLNYILNV